MKGKKGAINNSRTRAANATAQEKYTEANRAVKNSVKTNKATFIEDLAKEAEDAQAQGNMKQLYEITRKLAGKYKRQTDLSKIRMAMYLPVMKTS